MYVSVELKKLDYLLLEVYNDQIYCFS